MARLTADDLREIGTKVFVEHKSTLKDEAEQHSFALLRDTALLIRKAYLDTLGRLPESAFEAQAADEEGNEVWSAGQVSSHLSGTSLWVENSIRELLGMPQREQSADLEPLTGTQLLSREDAVKAMEYANRDFDALLDQLPDEIDENAASQHDYFGTMTVKSWLLMDALHAGQHVEQIKALAEKAAA